MANWLEYMTSPSKGDLAEERSANGRDEPWAVTHFGVGNESWDCGGHMEPEYYTSLYKQWGTFLRTPWNARPKPGTPTGGLYQQNSLRDAVVAGLNLTPHPIPKPGG